MRHTASAATRPKKKRAARYLHMNDTDTASSPSAGLRYNCQIGAARTIKTPLQQWFRAAYNGAKWGRKKRAREEEAGSFILLPVCVCLSVLPRNCTNPTTPHAQQGKQLHGNGNLKNSVAHD